MGCGYRGGCGGDACVLSLLGIHWYRKIKRSQKNKNQKNNMIKQNYIAIAGVIKEARSKRWETGYVMENYITDELIQIFKTDNPLFNAEKFKEATLKKATLK